MNKGVTITVLILFAIAIGIYFGFIYLVANAGG